MEEEDDEMGFREGRNKIFLFVLAFCSLLFVAETICLLIVSFLFLFLLYSTAIAHNRASHGGYHTRVK